MPSPQPFHVDLRGVVDLLSTAIYSSPQVYLRELIQNAVDAITARQVLDPSWRTAGVVITPATPARARFTIEDDGIGLTPAEVRAALATVGSSLKRDELGQATPGLLGRFGIGLLSALMVSDSLIVTTRSARGGPTVTWVGRSDGTYEITTGDEGGPAGTRVELITRADDVALVDEPAVTRLARHYAGYLPVPILIVRATGSETINTSPGFLADDSEELLAGGDELVGHRALAAFRVEVPLTGTTGAAYVLARPVPPHAVETHRVHLGRMLVSERSRQILPAWAFFVRCAITSTGLTPTASRESLVEDGALEATRVALGQQVREWFVHTATADPETFARFVAVHYLGLKALVIHEPELAPLFVRHLPLETSRGMWTIGEVLEHTAVIRYVTSTDQFRQVNALAADRDLIVNAAYTWDLEVLSALPEIVPGVAVREVGLADIIERLDPVPRRDAAAAADLEERAGAVLQEHDAQVVVRLASGPDQPAYLLRDPGLLRRTEREQARERGGSTWASLMQVLEDQATLRPEPAARMVLNWANPLVRTLAQTRDQVSFDRTVGLLHLQAVLAGGRPLNAAENQRLTRLLGDLMALAMPSNPGDGPVVAGD